MWVWKSSNTWSGEGRGGHWGQLNTKDGQKRDKIEEEGCFYVKGKNKEPLLKGTKQSWSSQLRTIKPGQQPKIHRKLPWKARNS